MYYMELYQMIRRTDDTTTFAPTFFGNEVTLLLSAGGLIIFRILKLSSATQD